MDVVFLGTAEFAVPTLDALLASAHHRVVGVVTQPDRPKGRERRLAAPPVKTAALAAGVPFLQSTDVNAPDALEWIRSRRPDAGVVVAFGQFLGRALRAIPAHGFVNLHASLLPRYRGAAPIYAAIRAGDRETGVSVIRVERTMDAGPVFTRRAVPIGPDDSAGELAARLAAAGAPLVESVLDALEAGSARAEPQDAARATQVGRIGAAERRLRWDRPAAELHDQVRALTPHPGTVAEYESQRGERFGVRITRTAVAAGASPVAVPAGTVLGPEGEEALRVRVQGAPDLLVVRLVPAGAREMTGVELLRGRGRGGGRFA
ncbi:MAG: methionyl-tRNA formyltransferase [Planctomycetes bacterium]|nr:methionyl-tRNA formyltransferase [Planctomycetota bacterium]